MVRRKGDVSTGTFGQKIPDNNKLPTNLIDLIEKLSNSNEITDAQLTRLGKVIGLNPESTTKTWVLNSGKVIKLKSVSLTRKEVEENTFVNFEINGRDQDLLTPESLKSLDSMKLQQFYPAIGRRTGVMIETLDGSRRREKFLQTPEIELFSMLITDDDITVEDAQQLAKDLQTAIAHNMYEIGLRCLLLSDYTQEQIAAILGINQTKVSRGLKAASIDRRLVMLFPNSNLLRDKDYSLLVKITEELKPTEKRFAAYIKSLEKSYEKDEELTPNEQHEALVTLIKSKLKSLSIKKEVAPTRVVTDLHTFTEKGKYARKITNKRVISYEFNRIPIHIQDELDAVIKELFKKNNL